MEFLGTWGQMTRNSLLSGGSALTGEVVDATITAAAAAAVGYASGKSNLKGKGGKIAGLPIPLAGALVLGGLAAAGVAGEMNQHVLSAAKGCLAAQAAMFGVKTAYQGSGQPATLAGRPAYAGALPAGHAYAMNPGLYGVPHMGATPATEQAFAQAGLVQG